MSQRKDILMSSRVVRLHRVLLAVGVLVVATGTGWALKNASESSNSKAPSDRPKPDVSFPHTPTSISNSTSTTSPVASLSPVHSPEIFGQETPVRDHRGKFPVTIRRPAGPPRVDLEIPSALTGDERAGKTITAACSTCHTDRPANFANRAPADLDEFHQNLAFDHGKVTCLSCHNPDNYDTLHLADGSSVEYSDVMTLCAQCHGPQTRDYRHGAHGGMIGYWDLSRGPRTRNNCVDCHDPHAPSFPAMKPTFKPRDRFLNSTIDAKKGHSEVHPHER